MWTDRQGKIQTFFGPGVTADIDFPKEQNVHVSLTCDGRCAALSVEGCPLGDFDFGLLEPHTILILNANLWLMSASVE